MIIIIDSRAAIMTTCEWPKTGCSCDSAATAEDFSRKALEKFGFFGRDTALTGKCVNRYRLNDDCRVYLLLRAIQ